MTIKWNLPTAMFNKGIFSATQLRQLMRERANYDISAPAVHRLVTGLPKEFKFATIDALCQALECSLDDVIVFEEPTYANKCIQPLVLGCAFKPPKRIKREREKIVGIDLPPT